MLNICDDIDELNGGYALMAHKYAREATFGRGNKALYSDILRLSNYINALERNKPSKITKVFKMPLEGQKVSLSSLRKQNNNLILDSEHLSFCSDIEYRPCLSDEEICTIVERAKLICYSYT